MQEYLLNLKDYADWCKEHEIVIPEEYLKWIYKFDT